MTILEDVAARSEHGTTTRRVLQRAVFPADRDFDAMPLYVDGALSPQVSAPVPTSEGRRSRTASVVTSGGATVDAKTVTGRFSLRVRSGNRVSLATYFNAFPASYWRRWTIVDTVRLVVELDAPASVVVYRSDASGNAQRVESLNATAGVNSCELPLDAFGDGGWYWFDLYADRDDVNLISAHWDADVPDRPAGTASIGITTFNQPGFCARQLRTLGADDGLREVIDTVYVVDQGTKKVRDIADFADIERLFDGRLQVINQGNLGGSGGFARGMFETATAGRSDYVLLMDDDVLSEPEGIRRAIVFADLCRRPTLVGGHMFSMYRRSLLHAYGEAIDPFRFFYAPAVGTKGSHDFASLPLRSTPWLHRRVDVDYNAWWMCLVPVKVVREIGLSLPIFIKWDDAEFGLRAKRAGYPTVTLPGAAVWHVPFETKDDSIDWQAYYHQRNRWLAAMLHTLYPRGGALIGESFRIDVKHLLSLQYSAVDLRLQALEDLLSGPEHLHRTIGTRLGEIRAARASHPDAVVKKDPAAFPDPGWTKPPRRGRPARAPMNIVAGVITAVTGAVRQLRPLDPSAGDRPEANVPASDAKWWRLSHLDSAIVSSADGTGASWYRRDPRMFRRYLARSVVLHRRLRYEWPRLQRQYRNALAETTSFESWDQTFRANSGDETAG